MDTAMISSGVLGELLDVGIALSNTRNLDVLLDKILREARRFANADAGTLYLARGNQLEARLGQCQTFIDRWGEDKEQAIFETFSIPIDRSSIAGSAASTKKAINIPDVQELGPNAPFRYSPDFDQKYDYSTHSNLAVPMQDPDGNIIGVLQLINARRGETIVPFDDKRVHLAKALASQAAVAIRNAMLTENLRAAHLDCLQRLGLAAEWRDKETANHITRVAHYCRILAEAWDWPPAQIELLVRAAPMHDVGKLGIPDAILHKPGKLDEGERNVMQAHTLIGANIMARSDNELMRWSRAIALGHHEKWDGTGYPQGWTGEQTPPACRIVALADVYDALSSRRVYKPPFPHEKTMGILESDAGTHFDPELVELFKERIDDVIAVRDAYADAEEDFAKYRDYENIQLE